MTLTLKLVDDVQIVVPNSLNLVTPYVLLEQQDWFEDEIKFLRHLLQTGQQVIDIGANYGTYSLSMAKKIGSSGKVWAFEPASSTAKLLVESIAINGFDHIILEQSALSNTSGTAQLSLNQNSELNSLIHNEVSAIVSETVSLTTLDECLEKYGWQAIDFMKIDAEGEEHNIIKGGNRFFAQLSPLIQYEVKTEGLHLELVKLFAELGYNSYRLVRGLNLLVPFDTESTADEYLLNLFCCKQDHAELLASQGFLVLPTSSPKEERLSHITDTKNKEQYAWYSTIGKLPYGIELGAVWEKVPISESMTKVYDALSFYALSQDCSFSATERFDALEASLTLLNSVCEAEPSYLRLASFARVARDYGERSLAVKALWQLIDAIFQTNEMNWNEPFLMPSNRFDSISPEQALANWILTAFLEEFERLKQYSSFYKRQTRTLEIIRDIGFAGEEMKRRLDLLEQRFTLSTP